jgi:riboflavin synthase
MFTGIISNLGRLEKLEKNFTFSAPRPFCSKIKKGDSVSVNGVCLTVEQKNSPTTFSVSVMPETRQKTTLDKLKIKDIVNLELPISFKTFLSGHFVQGHVDSIGKISNTEKKGNSQILTITVSAKLSRYIVKKGSITINGVSLTVVDSQTKKFTVAIIPYTWEHTTFNQIKIGDLVNIEVDIVARYLEKFLKK